MSKILINQKGFDKENLNTGFSKDSYLEKINDLKNDNESKDIEIENLKIENANLKDSLETKIKSSETRSDLTIITNEIRNSDLNISEKAELLKYIYLEYQKKFNEVSSNYEELKKDIQFLLQDINTYTGLAQIAFILTAKRLKKIRDSKLYLEAGYENFKEFYNKELHTPESTVYTYIAIIELFPELSDSSTNRVTDCQYTKLIPFLPLLKNDNVPKKDKEKIRNNALDLLSSDKTQKEIIGITKDLKLKYGLIKDAQNKTIDTLIESFINQIYRAGIEIKDIDSLKQSIRDNIK